MNDLDQIAANADNLISILQSIKQKNLTNTKVTPNFASTVPSVEQEEQRQPTPVVKKEEAEDFWDNHTHSPPQLK